MVISLAFDSSTSTDHVCTVLLTSQQLWDTFCREVILFEFGIEYMLLHVESIPIVCINLTVDSAPMHALCS